MPDGLGIRDCSLRGIIDLDGNAQRLIVGKDEARELGQRDDGRTEFRPVLLGAVALLAPMHVQRPHERRPLSAVVVQPEQLETAVVLGAQVAFYVVLVAKPLQAYAGHEEALCLLSHAIVAQQVLENLEVASLVDARVLWYLLEVGEDAPLSHFMSHDRVRVGLLLLVVDWILQQLIVVIVAVRRSLIPVQASCSGLDMIVGPLFPSPATAHAGSAVDAVGVVLPHRLHPVLAVRHPVSGRFVACRHHAKRRMMSVGIDDPQSFV